MSTCWFYACGLEYMGNTSIPTTLINHCSPILCKIHCKKLWALNMKSYSVNLLGYKHISIRIRYFRREILVFTYVCSGHLKMKRKVMFTYSLPFQFNSRTSQACTSLTHTAVEITKINIFQAAKFLPIYSGSFSEDISFYFLYWEWQKVMHNPKYVASFRTMRAGY